MTKGQMWDELMDMGVTEETLQIVTSINGYSEDTLEDILYVVTGYRSFGQLQGEFDDHDEEFDEI